MAKTLEFSDLLRLIDERTSAFQAVVTAAPSLDVPVPSCPGWTLLDLVQHLGKGRRRWAAIVAAGPAEAPPAGTHPTEAPDGPAEREALLAWLAEGSELLLSALRAAGPDRGCWTWWDRSESPQTSGGVARHQVQEVAVHTYDAQLALGAAQPLPDVVALDGVDEFLSTSCAGSYPWPYEQCTVDYQVTGGPSWRLWLAADVVRIYRFPAEAPDPADASIRDTASELVLFLYGRHPLDAMKVEGDPHLFNLLIEWDPDA